MLVRDIPDTAHGRLRMVEATAWLAALELRQHRPEAALVCEAIEILVEALSSLAADREGTHVKLILDSCGTWAGCKLLMLLRWELRNADFVVPTFDLERAFFH